MEFNGKTMTAFATFGMSTEGAVLYTEQTLTGEQKEQARANIGAASSTEITNLHQGLDRLEETFDESIGDIETALDSIIAIQNELIGGDA